MDQIKIGRFIADRRKAQGLTQAALAEKLNITDRAVSKWETGKSMPDSSIMLELCGLLQIDVNELLSGEKLNMEDYKKMAEENLMQLRRQEEAANRKLLSLEWVIGLSGTAALFMGMFAAAFAVENRIWQVALIVVSLVVFLADTHCALWLEQSVGYYACPKCGERYVPTMGAVFLAPHIGRTRYMKCPRCGQRAWQKKALTQAGEETGR